MKRMIGNALQSGVPDYLAMHLRHGMRWIDFKNPANYEFTDAQIQEWPVWEKNGTGIWIITAATQEQYDLLFTRWPKGNWRDYWKPKYDLHHQDVNEALDAITEEDVQMAMHGNSVRHGIGQRRKGVSSRTRPRRK